MRASSFLPSARTSASKPVSLPISCRGNLVTRATRLENVNGCWVSTPKGPPKGIVHFLGGAFAGAAPQLLYPVIINQLAAKGYTVIAVPFPVTFQHRQAAKDVHSKFLSVLSDLRQGGRRWEAPEDVPIFGVGHSMGSHLHLLIGSTLPVQNTSNILMSYNNKGVADAIPIPGLLDSLPSVMNFLEPVLEQSGIKLPSLQELTRAAGGTSALIDPSLLQQLGLQLQPAVDQIPMVLREVQKGSGNFDPTPAECRQLIGSSYNVKNTLFIRFLNDNIDETPEMYRLVQSRNRSGTAILEMPGSHVTPCAQEVAWDIGRQFTPFDAVGMGVKALVLNETLRTTDRIVGWMDSFSVRQQQQLGGGY